MKDYKLTVCSKNCNKKYLEQIVFTKGYNYESVIIAWEKDNPLMEVLQIEKVECDLNPKEGERNA